MVFVISFNARSNETINGLYSWTLAFGRVEKLRENKFSMKLICLHCGLFDLALWVSPCCRREIRNVFRDNLVCILKATTVANQPLHSKIIVNGARNMITLNNSRIILDFSQDTIKPKYQQSLLIFKIFLTKKTVGHLRRKKKNVVNKVLPVEKSAYCTVLREKNGVFLLFVRRFYFSL